MIPGVEAFGRVLLILGAVIFLIGLAIVVAGRIPFLGRLPGDILIQRDNVTVWIPFATMILLSVALSLIMFLVNLALRR